MHAHKHISGWKLNFFKHAEAELKKGCAYKKTMCIEGLKVSVKGETRNCNASLLKQLPVLPRILYLKC